MQKLLLVLLIGILGYVYYPKIKPILFKPTAMDSFYEFNQSEGDYWKINHLITKEYNDRFWRYPEKIAQQHLKQRYVPLESSKISEHKINDDTTVIFALTPDDKYPDRKEYKCFIVEKIADNWKVAGSTHLNNIYPELLARKPETKLLQSNNYFTYDNVIFASKSAWAYSRGGNGLTITFYEYPINDQMVYDHAYGADMRYHFKNNARQNDDKFKRFEFTLVMDEHGKISKRSQTSILFYRQDTNWDFTHEKLWMDIDVIQFAELESGSLTLKTKGEKKDSKNKIFSWDIDIDIPVYERGCNNL